jgi:hypothetical protein
MLKTVSILEEKIGEKIAALHLDATMTLGEVHDALHKMLADIVGRIEAAAKAAAPEAVAAVVAQPATVAPVEAAPVEVAPTQQA